LGLARHSIYVWRCIDWCISAFSLTYFGICSVSRCHIAQSELQSKTSTLGVEISSARERAATLEKEAADARSETERLKQVVAWRTIAPVDALKLENALVGKPGAVNLRFMDGDPEALFLAIQFSQILSKAHWQVAPGALKPANAIVFGISLPDATSADAQTLRAAFVAAGIAFSPNPVPGGQVFQSQ